MSATALRVCPSCGAEDTIFIDFALGEAACHECGTVVAMGLLEDDGTRYDGPQLRDGGADDDGGGGGGSAAAAASSRGGGGASSSSAGGAAAHKPAAMHPTVAKTLATLKERLPASDAVADSARQLFIEYATARKARGEVMEKSTAAVAACLHIASALKHEPLPVFELASVDPTLRTTDIENARQAILRTLSNAGGSAGAAASTAAAAGTLEANFKAANATLVRDLCSGYQLRLRCDPRVRQAAESLAARAIPMLATIPVATEIAIIACFAAVRAHPEKFLPLFAPVAASAASTPATTTPAQQKAAVEKAKKEVYVATRIAEKPYEKSAEKAFAVIATTDWGTVLRAEKQRKEQAAAAAATTGMPAPAGAAGQKRDRE